MSPQTKYSFQNNGKKSQVEIALAIREYYQRKRSDPTIKTNEPTGNYYYGARYYNPKWSIWNSVDPLAEKTGTPYAYCYNNPINLTDPTGMEPDGGGGITPPPEIVGKGVQVGDRLVYKDVTYTATSIKKGGFLKRDKVEWTYYQNEYSSEYVGDEKDRDPNDLAFMIVAKSVPKTAYSKIKRWSGKELDIPQGNDSQEFFYIYSGSRAGRTSMGGDAGYFRSGDRILPIDWDKMVRPGGGGFQGKTTTKNLATHLFRKYFRNGTAAPGKAQSIYSMVQETIREDTIISEPRGYGLDTLWFKVDKDSLIKDKENSRGTLMWNNIYYPGNRDTINKK